MEDKNKLSDEVGHMPKKQGSGSLLAEARKKQNRSVEEIADELNLSVTQIRTIELDQSEGLPEPTYVRGYIRSYANLLGLDATMVLDHYLNPNWQKGARLDEMPRGIGSANESDGRGFFTPLKTIGLLAIIGVVAFLWFSGAFNKMFGDTTTVTTSGTRSDSSAPEPTPTTSIPSAPVVAQATDSELSEAPADDAAQSEASASVEGVPTEGEGADNPAVDVNEQQLTLNFSDTSWIDIRDADGTRLAYKTYAKGDVLNVSTETRMTVFIGNANAVTVQHNGQDFDLAPHREGVFARFVIEQ